MKKKIETKKVGSITADSGVMTRAKRGVNVTAPVLSDRAKREIRGFREAQAETATQAHNIRLG